MYMKMECSISDKRIRVAGFESVWNHRALKGRMTQAFAHYNTAQTFSAIDKSFKSLGCDFLVSRYGTKFEEGSAGKKCGMW